MKRKRVIYRIRSERIAEKTRLAVAADLHSAPFEDVTEDLASCDAVLIPGDLVDRHRRNNSNACRFLQIIPDMVPVFYAIGNHERKFRQREEYYQKVRESKAQLLDNESTEFRGIAIGALSSCADRVPDLQFLDRFEKSEGFRLLMCHHPEMYRDFVRGRDIDLTVCGHAHGGQIQLGGRGLYAPGQGHTYIEKDASINDEIDRLRHSATSALRERKDVIIVASVSCIYSMGDPSEYGCPCRASALPCR